MPSSESSLGLAIFFIIFWMYTAGFSIPKDQIPVWWGWCYYANPIRYVLEGLWLLTFGCTPHMDHTGDCHTIYDGTQSKFVTTHRYMHDKFGINADVWGGVFIDIAALLGFIAVLKGMQFYCVTYIKHQST